MDYLHASLNHDMISSVGVNRRVSSEVNIPVVGVPGDAIDVSSGIPEVQLDVDGGELTAGEGEVELGRYRVPVELSQIPQYFGVVVPVGLGPDLVVMIGLLVSNLELPVDQI